MLEMTDDTPSYLVSFVEVHQPPKPMLNDIFDITQIPPKATSTMTNECLNPADVRPLMIFPATIPKINE